MNILRNFFGFDDKIDVRLRSSQVIIIWNRQVDGTLLLNVYFVRFIGFCFFFHKKKV